jgi:hypothetical protein
MSEDEDIALVESHLAERKLAIRRLPEVRSRKTPDLEILREDGVVLALCEVKSPRDDFLEKLWAVAAPGQHTVGGARPDPVFNRIARQIVHARDQLEAHDPDRGVPRVVAIVNHDRACNVLDLVETVTGRRPGFPFATNPINPKFTRDALGAIDAVMWVDAKGRNRPSWFFTETQAEYFDALQAALGLHGVVRY